MQRALVVLLDAIARFSKVGVGQQPSGFAIDTGLQSTLLSHRLKDSLWVGLHSETDLVIIVLISLGRPETHIIQLLVSSGAAHCLKSRRIVHVDVRRWIAPLRMIHDVILTEWALIELVNIASIKMLGHVKHVILSSVLFLIMIYSYDSYLSLFCDDGQRVCNKRDSLIFITN